MAQNKQLKLTKEGMQKFKSLDKILSKRFAELLTAVEAKVKYNIAKYAPDAAEEAFVLSLPGTPYDFFKNDFLTLKEAINAEVVPIEKTKNRIFALYGNVEKMSPLIGFSWYKGKYGKSEKRSTTDSNAGAAWKNLLAMWEYGGSFTVVSRDPGGRLTIAFQGKNPITVDSAVKTIHPRSMYQSSEPENRKLLINYIESTLKDGIKEAGFQSLT